MPEVDMDIVPESIAISPLDVPSVKAKVTTKEIVDIVREVRERYNRIGDTNDEDR
jgi:hypothetical protein